MTAQLSPTCPECGEDMATKNRRAHGLKHWGEKVNHPEQLPPEGRARVQQLLGVA